MVVRDWQEEKSKYEDDLVLKRGELDRYQREVDALEKEAQRTTTTNNKQRTKSPRCTKNNARQELLENRVKQLRDEIDVLLSILHDMKRDHNHNVQDKAVKIAIAGYDDFLAEYDTLGEDMDQLDTDIDDDDDVDDNGDDADGDHFANEGESTAETEELDRLRQVRDGLDVDVRGLETKIKDVNEKLNNDYGKQREWLKLENTCVEKDDGEYIYSLCVLGGASQKSHKDGSNINLGQFEKFVGEHDDAIYLQHAHTRGLRCWNGPERSVRAIYECGGKTEILDVMETEKCEYQFRMRTPAVCPNPDDDQGVPSPKVKIAEHIHEEL
ncbi:unnamed protein product [Absidia cylindrospora]